MTHPILIQNRMIPVAVILCVLGLGRAGIAQPPGVGNALVVAPSMMLSTLPQPVPVQPNLELQLTRDDTDGDGLPDEWEMQYFGSLHQGPDDDPDIDGLSNLCEYEAGTDPTDDDTDGDNCFDGDEVDAGLDPLDDSDCDASVWPIFLLDVGSASDNDPGASIYLDEGSGVSLRTLGEDRTYRTLNESSYLYFRVDTSSVDLDSNGVPYRHAIIDIDYKDVVDETNCYKWSSSRAYCRPRLRTFLDYGENPPLEWHAIGAMAGLDDDAWKQTSLFVEANPWQTLRSIDGFFEFYIHYPNQETSGDPFPIDSITVRFIGDSRFHTLRELDRAERTFVRSDYVEENTLDPAEYGSYMVYSRNYLEKIYPNTVPEPDEIAPRLSTFEIAGECEPVTFSIYSFDDPIQVGVEPGDLIGWDGAIAASNIRVDAVFPADKRWEWSANKYYGIQPWYLDAPETVVVPAGTSRQFWVTIDVPEKTSAGIYAGNLTLWIFTGTTFDHYTLPLTVMVYEIDLESPDATTYVYHSPYLSSKRYAQRNTIVSQNMADHDVNPIMYLDATIDLGDYSIDFHDLADELDEFAALGILPPKPRVGISDNVYQLWNSLCSGQPYYTGDCPEFDDAYTAVLHHYAEYYASWGVEPVLSFNDEPGNDPDKRRRSNRLNRLAKAAGLETWVTYYPRCEEPLAGYTLSFEDFTGGVTPGAPEWLTTDPHLSAYWPFDSGTEDQSTNGNDGALNGGASVSGGALNLPSNSAYMRVPHDESLSYPEQCTIYFWFKPAECADGYAYHPIEKWDTSQPGYAANYVFYFFGDYHGAYPDNNGRVGVYAAINGNWTKASGNTCLDCDSGMELWYNLMWVWDATVGGTLYVNGMPYSREYPGTLTTNTRPVDFGKFVGSMDDIVMLDRSLTESEVTDIVLDINTNYDQGQTVSISLTVPDPATMPTTLTFSINDDIESPEVLETLKELAINGQTAWSCTTVSLPHQLVSVDLAPFVLPEQPNEITFNVTNRHARQEELLLYFVEDFWRQATWAVTGASASDNWSSTYEPDDDGTMGPMATWLDDRVYAMRYVTAEQAERTWAEGDTFSYYTTYPANQPVILNNRFLNGVYASALGAKGVYVYAYGDWGSQPWDDCEVSYARRMGTESGQRSYGGYQLVLPSWDDRIYDTVIFESLREGVEDSRIIATLKKAIAEHPGPRAQLAQAYLDDLFAGPSRDYSPRYMHTDESLPIHKYADRSEEVLSDLVGDGEDFAAFDRIRLRMIWLILTLNGDAPDCNINGLPDGDETISPGDFDNDGDVDLDDFAALVTALAGPDVLPGVTECLDFYLAAFDSDEDNDVDLNDFAAFQTLFGGE
ncbi:MAG: hypothetical protein KAV82_02175 [Phycisphaerae bacterium]|nr:hypothetical protein [Phycisphaerae bacterium]